MSKVRKVAHLITGPVLNLVVNLLGVFLLCQAIYGWGLNPDSELERIMALIIGVWILSMYVFDKRFRSISESLNMIMMSTISKDVVGAVNLAYDRMKEIQKHGAEAGNSAEAAQEKDAFDTTAKTGAHE